MKKQTKSIVVRLSAVVLVLVLISILSINQSNSKVDNKVPLTATYLPPSEDTANISFLISINDHEIDLSDLDIAGNSYIQIDDKPRLQAKSWLLINKGHHLKGKLYFPVSRPEKAKNLRLIITGIQAAPLKMDFLL